MRLPALELEDLVTSTVIGWLRDEVRIVPLLPDVDAHTVQSILREARALADQIEASPAEHLRQYIERITVKTDTVRIALNLEAIAIETDADGDATAEAVIEVPARTQRCGLAMRLIVPGPNGEARRSPDPKLVGLLTKAQDWLGRLISGKAPSISAIAKEAGVGPRSVTRVIYLALLAPDIVERIVRGEHPPTLTVDRLMRMVPLPTNWNEQGAALGFT